MEWNRLLIVGAIILILLTGSFIYNFHFNGPYNLTTDYPQANLEFDYQPENESLTVIHSKGQPFDQPETKTLEVYVFPVNEAQPASPRTTVDLPFTEGDAFTLQNVTENDRVTIVWQSRLNSHTIADHPISTDEE